jgi:hypothetical protein
MSHAREKHKTDRCCERTHTKGFAIVGGEQESSKKRAKKQAGNQNPGLTIVQLPFR